MQVIDLSGSISKEDAAKMLGLTTFDYALPQSWFDKMQKITDKALSCFVWCYDKVDGMPF